jgi:flagellar capping protein FliD
VNNTKISRAINNDIHGGNKFFYENIRHLNSDLAFGTGFAFTNKSVMKTIACNKRAIYRNPSLNGAFYSLCPL